MRLFGLGMGLAALAGCAMQTQAPPQQTAQTGLPVIEHVHLGHSLIPRFNVTYTEFFFVAPGGDVKTLHREIIATDRPQLHFNAQGQAAPGVDFITDTPVEISPGEQRHGSVIYGKWQCAPVPYYVKLRAVLVTDAGMLSNPVDYTIHCNGG